MYGEQIGRDGNVEGSHVSLSSRPPQARLPKVESGRRKGVQGGWRGAGLPLEEMSAVSWLRGQIS